MIDASCQLQQLATAYSEAVYIRIESLLDAMYLSLEADTKMSSISNHIKLFVVAGWHNHWLGVAWAGHSENERQCLARRSPYLKKKGARSSNSYWMPVARGGCVSGVGIIYLHTLVMQAWGLLCFGRWRQIQNAIMIGLMFCRLSRGTSRARLRAVPQEMSVLKHLQSLAAYKQGFSLASCTPSTPMELPSEYLLGSPKSSASLSPSASARSARSGSRRHRAWKSADAKETETLSREALRLRTGKRCL